METIFEILKWTALVFAAGFIGYFGRHLSKMIISRLTGRKKPRPSSAEAAEGTTEKALDKQRLKIEKKRLKAEQKKIKKSSK